VTVHRRSLVLNQNYEPLNVCAGRRAFVLVLSGKAEILEQAADPIHGVGRNYHLPSVIRLRYAVRRPRPRVRLTRREVFARDGQRCQYCGREGRDLTLDHVLPRHRGGQHDWENIVAACRPCNHHKGGRTPTEARMRLLTRPRRPSVTAAELFAPYLDQYQEWRPFISGWLREPAAPSEQNGHAPAAPLPALRPGLVGQAS
jgi:5-methylcytosine-specific restriction endonuclease McrA